jgi:hypothetical protein
LMEASANPFLMEASISSSSWIIVLKLFIRSSQKLSRPWNYKFAKVSYATIVSADTSQSSKMNTVSR